MPSQVTLPISNPRILATKRLQFATFLHATNLLPYLRSESHPDGKVRFVFRDDQHVGHTLELEYDHGASVPARDLFSSQTFLRREMSTVLENRKMENTHEFAHPRR
jgi:hypothetical protein